MPSHDLIHADSSYLARPHTRWFWLLARASRWSPHTIAGYETAVKDLCEWARDVGYPEDPLALSVDHLREWIIALSVRPVKDAGLDVARSGNVSGYTVHTYAKNIRAYFNHAVEEKRLAKSRNPWGRVKVPPPPKRKPKLYESADIERMLALCPHNVYWGARDRALILTYLYAGLRLSELATLALGDLDLDRGRMKVLGKGDKERFVGLHPQACAAISRWLMYRPEDCGHDRVFTAVHGPACAKPVTANAVGIMMRRLQQRAGVNVPRAVHALRHTFAVHALLDGNAPGRMVQEWLGHESYASTAVYLQAVDEMRATEAQRELPLYPGWNLGMNGRGR